MRTPRRGTIVCREAVISLGDGDPFPILRMYARPAGNGQLLVMMHTVLREPFELVLPRSVPEKVMSGHATSTQTTVGELRIRPVQAEDATWLPVDHPIDHSVDMLGAFLEGIDQVESMDHGGPYKPDDAPISCLELLLDTDRDLAIGVRWRVTEPLARPATWIRINREWIADPSPGRELIESVNAYEIHAMAARAILDRFDRGQPINRLIAHLAGRHQNSAIHRSDLPEHVTEVLAQEWLEPPHAGQDILSFFVEGRAEIATEVILNTLLQVGIESERFTAPNRLPQELPMASELDTGWKQFAQLAQEAGQGHLEHDPCESLPCMRYHACLSLFEERDGTMHGAEMPLASERLGTITMLEGILDSLPVRTPFRGLLEVPPGFRQWYEKFGSQINLQAKQLTDTYEHALVVLYRDLFPSCGSIDVEEYLTSQGLAPLTSGDDLY